MRATSWWWVLPLGMLWLVWIGTGCNLMKDGRQFSLDESSGESNPDDPLPTTSAEDAPCPGKCVAQPAAPFNSKVHLFWIGPGRDLPDDCPETAPLHGMLGHVLSMDMPGSPEPDDGQWVRECLISNDADPCSEGTTCAPVPPESYELCISRENDGPCPADYYPQHIVAQELGEPPASPLTLCCTSTRPVRKELSMK